MGKHWVIGIFEPFTSCVKNVHFQSHMPQIILLIVEILYSAPVLIAVGVEEETFDDAAFPNSLSTQDDQPDALIIAHCRHSSTLSGTDSKGLMWVQCGNLEAFSRFKQPAGGSPSKVNLLKLNCTQMDFMLLNDF